MTHDGFQIEAFEAGKGLWHARIRREDFEPVVIDGVSFPELEVGFAWSDAEAAIGDVISDVGAKAEDRPCMTQRPTLPA
jgi:hypothetical protein